MMVFIVLMGRIGLVVCDGLIVFSCGWFWFWLIVRGVIGWVFLMVCCEGMWWCCVGWKGIVVVVF